MHNLRSNFHPKHSKILPLLLTVSANIIDHPQNEAPPGVSGGDVEMQ
jgi:hypothetical protein